MTVARLGTFTARYERAWFDSAEGVFYPSKIRILFSQKEIEDNGLLHESLKRKLKLKDNEAFLEIEKFVKIVKGNLKKNHYCRLEGIGYLINQDNNTLTLKDTFWKRYKYQSVSPMAI